MSSGALTYESLIKLLQQFKPIPYVAFTFNPATYEGLKQQCRVAEVTDLCASLEGVDVFCVEGQEQNCLKWVDKEELHFYMSMMRAQVVYGVKV